MNVAHFTVSATAEQSARWKQAAAAEGHRSAGTWLARAADAYLKARARAGAPIPLMWCRGRFKVALTDGAELEVLGMVSPPFGEFEGNAEIGRRQGYGRRTLVHLPSGRIIATLRTAGQCKALASELAPAFARDDPGAGIVERYKRESV